MRLLMAETDTANFIHRINTSISYSAFLFRITGTMAAASNFTLAQIGRLVYRIRNTTYVDCDFACMSALDNIAGGVAETTGLGTNNVPFAASVLIPRGYFDDNVEFVTPQDTAEFAIQFNTNVATNSTGAFLAELYAIEEHGLQSYNLMIKQQELNIGGAGNIPDNIITIENITAMYVTDIVGGVFTLAASPVTRMRFTVGNLFGGEFATGAILAKTNLANRVETAQSIMAEIFAAKVGDISSKLEDTAQVVFTTTAAARPQTISLGVSFNPNKLSETAAIASQRLQGKLTAKEGSGKRRTAETVKSITQAS